MGPESVEFYLGPVHFLLQNTSFFAPLFAPASRTGPWGGGAPLVVSMFFPLSFPQESLGSLTFATLTRFRFSLSFFLFLTLGQVGVGLIL